MISTLCAFSQTKEKQKITGIIKTTSGNPAEYFSVSIKGTNRGCTTDDNGNFSLETLSGSCILEIASLSSTPEEFPILIQQGQDNFYNLTVSDKKNQLNEVVVTSLFAGETLRNSVYRVRIIDQKKIEEKGATSIENVLNTEIGIRISNDLVLGETQFEVMGMSGSNVKVLIDGIPMVERSSNQQILSQIDISTVDKIEIIEGPMSVIYGSDALAGVINIITKTGKAKPGNSLYVTGHLQEESVGDEYQFGSGEGNHVQGVSAGYTFNNGIYIGGNFSHNDFGGWFGNNPQRAKEWPSKEQYLVGGQVGVKKEVYSLQYKFDYLDEEILKRGDISVINKATDEKFLAKRYTHQLHGNWDIANDLKLTLTGSYQKYNRDKRRTLKNFITGEKQPSTAADANDDTEYDLWFTRATALWKTNQKLSLLAGVEYQNDKGKGDKMSSDASAINNLAFFLSVEYSPLDWISIRPGVRSTYNSEYSAPWAIPSLNLKLILTPSMDMRLSYAKGFRAPRIQELYYEMYHTNGGGFWIRGNKDLKAEKSDSYMASYVWRTLDDEKTKLSFTLSGFYNKYKNQIRLVTSADVSNNQMYQNIDHYRTQGLTFESNFILDRFTVQAAFSYIGRYNRLAKDEAYASENPDKMKYSPEVSGSVSYDWKNVATLNLFYKYTGARKEYKEYTGKSSDTYLGLGKQEGYHWADFTVSRPIYKMFNLSVGIRNIFNVKRLDNTIESSSYGTQSTDQTLISSGRSCFASLTFNFNK